jgi:hypothetical protein
MNLLGFKYVEIAGEDFPEDLLGGMRVFQRSSV